MQSSFGCESCGGKDLTQTLHFRGRLTSNEDLLPVAYGVQFLANPSHVSTESLHRLDLQSARGLVSPRGQGVGIRVGERIGIDRLGRFA